MHATCLLRQCLDRMGWILGVSMESCHHKREKYNIWKYFPPASFLQMVRLDMLTEFCISHSLESCLALSNFSWSHSHIRSPSQNYLLTWLHLAPSLLSTGVFNGSLERHVCTWFKPRYTTHFTLPSHEQQRPRFFLPEKNHRCESHEHTTNFCSWFQPVIFDIFSSKKW